MYWIVLSIMLFSNLECRWCSNFKNLQAWGYQVPPPSSVDTDCLPYFVDNSWINNHSATSILLSTDIRIPRTILSIGSIATTIHSHTYSLLTLSSVSSIKNKFHYLLLFLFILNGLLWFVYLNPIPNRNMISLYDRR